MSATIVWDFIESGHYRGRYQGHVLEVKRNPDGSDKRRYVGCVDGEMVVQPSWTVPLTKTKLIRFVNHGPSAAATLRLPKRQPEPQPEPQPQPAEDADDLLVDIAAEPQDQAVVPYVEPSPPAEPEDFIELSYTIRGTMRVLDLGEGWNHLKTTVDMLRDWGPAEGEAVPPAKVRL